MDQIATPAMNNSTLVEIRDDVLISLWISFGSYALIFLLHAVIHDLRKSSYGTCYIIYSITALSHHAYFFSMHALCESRQATFKTILENYNYIFCSIYFFLEFSMYMWINTICFDVFYSMRDKRLRSILNTKHKFILELVACYVIPAIIVIAMWIFLGSKKMMEMHEKKIQNSSTLKRSDGSASSFGLVEVFLRSLRLIFLSGVVFTVWNSNRKLRNLGVATHVVISRSDKIKSRIQLAVIFHVVVNLLILNLITMIISMASKESNDTKMWRQSLHPVIECIKLLIGFYVLIFIVFGKNFISIVDKWIQGRYSQMIRVFSK